MGTPQVRHLATLAGNVISAEGNAEGLVALLALGADAEITNLTGAQWLPVATLLARSGVSRVDSSAEIVTLFRVRPLEPGQGSALERAVPLTPAGATWPGRAPLVLAAALTLGEGDVIVNSAWVLGVAGDLPVRLAAVERELAGAEALAPATRKSLAAALSDQAGSRPAVERVGNGAAQEIRRLGLRAFDRAIKMAQQTRDAAAGWPGPA
jgi:carbon-monoxide dehydrogenase medium subunit